MKPIAPYIVIEPAVEAVKKTEGGLLLTEDQGQIRYVKATILKKPDGLDILDEGDTIYYDKRAGHVLDIGGKEFTIIRAGDIVIVE